MKKRPIKELLQLMLDNKKLFKRGLCLLSRDMREAGVINTAEELLLDIYIYINSPDEIYDVVYNWPPTKWEPREKWIKEQIKKQNS